MDIEKMIIGVVVAITIIGAFILVPIGAYFEARTFNKFSDKKANTFDALFADLRVEACRNN